MPPNALAAFPRCAKLSPDYLSDYEKYIVFLFYFGLITRKKTEKIMEMKTQNV